MLSLFYYLLLLFKSICYKLLSKMRSLMKTARLDRLETRDALPHNFVVIYLNIYIYFFHFRWLQKSNWVKNSFCSFIC